MTDDPSSKLERPHGGPLRAFERWVALVLPQAMGTRLLVIFLVLTVVPLAASSLMGYSSTRRAMTRKVGEVMHAVARGQECQVIDFMAAQGSPVSGHALSESVPWSEDRREAYSNLLRMRFEPGFRGRINVLGPEGDVIVSEVHPPEGPLQPLLAGTPHPVASRLQGPTAEGSAEWFEPSGVELVAFARQVMGSSTWVIVELPTADAFADLEELRRKAYVYVSLLILVVAVAVRTTVKRTTTPLEVLVASAGRMGDGDLGQEIHEMAETAPLETRQLIVELERMSRELKSAHDELEARVAERTGELTAALEAQRKLQVQMVHHEKMVAIGTLSAGMAHEIGNPLAAISAEVQIALRADDPRHARDSLGLVRRHTDRIAKILREMVDFSRRNREEEADVSLNRVISDTARLIRHDARSRRVQVVLDLDPDVPSVRSAEDPLVQVFLNLILNALDATPDAGEIRIVTARDDDGVSVEVRDTGTGISQDDAARAFEPFYTTKPPGEGTGLGLHVSSEIIASLGGTIAIEGLEPHGCVVRIFLPASDGSEA